MPSKRKATSQTKSNKKAKLNSPVVQSIDSFAITKLDELKITHYALIRSAMLVDVDLVKNKDNFCVLQILRDALTSKYYFFQRSGRSGTNGDYELTGPSSEANATVEFDAKFLEKTGSVYDPTTPFKKLKGRYDLLKDIASTEAGTWEYFVSDFVDGKSTGWYPYTKDGSERMEFLWQTLQSNQGYTKRIIQSGHFSYLIDLIKMTQTNIKTNKQRVIRRTLSTKTIKVSAPLPSLEVIQPKNEKAETKAKAKAKVLHEFSIATVDGKLMEVNLAHIDIPAGMDKFVDLSMVYCKKDVYIWRIEGIDNVQVNESFEGPMTREEGVAAFKEQYENYTGNAWGEAFVKQPNKYDLLQVPTSLDIIEEYANGKYCRVMLSRFIDPCENELIEDVYRWYKYNPQYPVRRIKMKTQTYSFDFSSLSCLDLETGFARQVRKMTAII